MNNSMHSAAAFAPTLAILERLAGLSLQDAVARARRVVDNPAHAMEVAEEAYFSLVVLACRGREPDNPRAWLGQVVRNLLAKRAKTGRLQVCSLDALDGDRRDAATVAADPEPGSAAALRNRLAALEPRLRRRLTERQARVFDLLRDNLGIREVARLTGMSPKDVRDVLRSIGKKARALVAA